MKQFKYLYLLLLLGIAACDKAEQIPGYIQIEPFKVDEDGGASYHDFNEAWVFVDNAFFGAYPIGGAIPVLRDGSTEVAISPGVLENGILNTPNLYPMMNRYTTTVDIVPGETVIINPRVEYDALTTVPIGGSEDFEEMTFMPFKDVDGDTSSFLKITDVDGAFGRYLRLDVDEMHTQNSIAMSQLMEGIPVTGGQEVWLEIHYKNDVPFTMFLTGAFASQPNFEQPQNVFSFNINEEWNKTYFNITQFVVATPYDLYGLGFAAFLGRDGNGNLLQTSGSVCIDNIKVIHF